MIEMNKKYRTRDGRSVRILCVDCQSGKADYPVVGLIREPNGLETIGRWGDDGSFQTARAYPQDLVPVPTKHDGWMVTPRYTPCGCDLFSTEEGARHHAEVLGGLVIHVTWDE